MKIAGVGAQFPQRIVSNDEILDLIRFYSKDTFNGDLDKSLRIIKSLFYKSSMLKRHWLSDKEKALDLMAESFNTALQQSGLAKEDIDLLIYTGVGRGVIEPANSCFIANYLGLKEVRSFDTLDACMGWVTSMDIVNAKMKAGEIKTAAIVNMEFNLIPDGHTFPKNFCLESMAAIEYKFPGFTFGDVATTTILTAAERDNFKFEFISRPQYADLCTISLPAYQHYCVDSERMQVLGGKYQFCSYGNDIHRVGNDFTIDVVKKLNSDLDKVDIVFPHTSSKDKWHSCGVVLGIADKIFHISQDTGNLASASIPAAMHLAFATGKLHRNMNCLLWMGSAGMSFAGVTCNF